MSGSEVSDDEQAAADAICAVLDDALCEPLEPPGHTKTPDWRVTLACGREADVEVTTCTDSEAVRFSEALHDDGLVKVWRDPRLSHGWKVWVSDHSRRYHERRSVTELVGVLCDTLVFVEALGGTPEQMAYAARMTFIDPHTFFNSPNGQQALMSMVRRGMALEDWLANGAPGSGYWYPALLLDYHNGDRRSLRVGVMGVPEPLGAGNGMVETHGGAAESGGGHGSPAPVVQRAIAHKTKKRQLDEAPDLKWLAVMVDGIPGFQLTHQFGSRSQPPPPTLEGISFDYFDEVWAIARDAQNYTVLRLSEGGDTQQHYVVPRVQ